MLQSHDVAVSCWTRRPPRVRRCSAARLTRRGRSPTATERGYRGFFCARDKADHVVSCFGTLPPNQDAPRERVIERVSVLDGAKFLAAAGGRVCAVLERGRIECWAGKWPGVTVDDWTAPTP